MLHHQKKYFARYIYSVIAPPLVHRLTKSIGQERAHQRLKRCARQLSYLYNNALPQSLEAHSHISAESIFIEMSYYQLQALL
ncbi:hypothetical protein [Filimonas lacunae]|uniref:hypothetical protein n=1 Tax=Filimonas lacunae TaxID=477680 RepID=UPI0007D713E5|nr:hypothetical protein [Filimonas lacunae]BAV04424.1 hypothetical protein FLA_0415 [Filimonas lacunae]